MFVSQINVCNSSKNFAANKTDFLNHNNDATGFLSNFKFIDKSYDSDNFIKTNFTLKNQNYIPNTEAAGVQNFRIYKVSRANKGLDKPNFSGLNGSAKVSIIVPVYNTGKYLKKALNSLKNQTLKDIEIICINDGSTDNSLKILNQYAAKDNRFRVITQKNQGPGVARNNGLKMVTGEYVGFMDPDDWLDINACETLYKQAKSQNSDVVAFNYNTYNEKGKKLEEVKLTNTISDEVYHLNSNECFNWRNIKPKEFFGLYYAAWNKIYKSAFLEKYHIKFTPCNVSEDNQFVIGATLNAGRISYCDKPFYNYLLRKGSAVHKYSNDNFCTFDVCSEVKKVVKDCGLQDELAEDYTAYAVDTLLHQYKRVPPENRQYFEQMCKEKLEPKYSEIVLRGIQDIKNSASIPKKNSFLDKIFSIKTEQEFGIDHKALTLFGIKFKIK